MGCGGYLNQYCELSADHSGRWTCCLCNHENSALFGSNINAVTAQEMSKLYPELGLDHVDYVEPSDTLSLASSSSEFLRYPIRAIVVSLLIPFL